MFGNVSEQFVSLKEYYCAGVGGGFVPMGGMAIYAPEGGGTVSQAMS